MGEEERLIAFAERVEEQVSTEHATWFDETGAPYRRKGKEQVDDAERAPELAEPLENENAQGLVREIKAKTGMESWRRDDETGQAYSLKLTDAGLKAIAADERDSQSIPSTAVPQNTNADSSKAKTAANMAAAPSATVALTATAPRQGTKIARVIELPQRDQGAKLEELKRVCNIKHLIRGGEVVRPIAPNCLRFPKLFPVVNKPINKYLKDIEFRAPSGASEVIAHVAFSVVTLGWGADYLRG